jgi:hypothetical protein
VFLDKIQWLGGSDSELGVFFFFLVYFLNEEPRSWEPRSYLEFPNHLIVISIFSLACTPT